jgi:hypothetical protein
MDAGVRLEVDPDSPTSTTGLRLRGRERTPQRLHCVRPFQGTVTAPTDVSGEPIYGLVDLAFDVHPITGEVLTFVERAAERCMFDIALPPGQVPSRCTATWGVNISWS